MIDNKSVDWRNDLSLCDLRISKIRKIRGRNINTGNQFTSVIHCCLCVQSSRGFRSPIYGRIETNIGIQGITTRILFFQPLESTKWKNLCAFVVTPNHGKSAFFCRKIMNRWILYWWIFPLYPTFAYFNIGTSLLVSVHPPTAPNTFWDCLWNCFLRSKHLLRGYLEH